METTLGPVQELWVWVPYPLSVSMQWVVNTALLASQDSLEVLTVRRQELCKL